MHRLCIAVFPCALLHSLLAQQAPPVKSTYVPAHPIVQRAPLDRASSSLIMEEMPLVAPLFIEERNMSSELVLVNNSSENAGSTISLRNLHGIETGHLHLVLKPHEDRHIPVRTLEANVASPSQYGSIVVMPDSDLKGPSIAGQLLITDRSSSTPAYLDEELAMPNMQGSSVLRSVTDDTERQPLLAVTNLSAQAQKAVIRCLGSDAKQRQNTLDLAPFATSLIAACSGSFVSDIDHFLSQATDRTSSGITGIEVVGDGVAGEIAAYAIAAHRRNSDVVFSSVPFTDPALIHSPDSVFAGVPIGPQPTLPNGVYIPRISLSNFASTPARVTVALHVTARSRMESSDGASSVVAPQTLASLTIPPRQTREVVLKGTESQSGLLNSVYVTSDRQPGEVQGKLVSRSDGSLYEIELLGKDVRDLENGGIHPWTAEDDAESHLILYNHSTSQKKFDVAVWNGTMLWDKTYYLDASETLEISFNQLIRDKVKDDRKQVLDPAFKSGVVNWSTPNGGDATGRLMVTSRKAVMARNYSCGSYIVPCGGVFQTLYDYIGINQTLNLFDLSVQYCSAWGPGQCGGNEVGSGSANFSSTTSAPSKIAFYNSSQNSQSPTMKGMAAGSSHFIEEADGNDCRVSDDGDGTTQNPGKLFVENDTESTPSCPNKASLQRQITYQIDDTTGTPMYSAIQLRENVPGTTSSCNNSVVHTGTTCTLNTVYAPGVVNEFTDVLFPGCPSATAVTPCGFQFSNQQWQACENGGQQTIGTIGPVNAQNSNISVDGNSTSLRGTFFQP